MDTPNNPTPPAVPGNPPVAPVAAPGVAVPPGHVAAPVHAKSSVPLFGGNASGKKRADGLKPGSPEAIAADKERDAKRKRDERAAARAAAEPAALPSAAPVSPGASPAASLPVDFGATVTAAAVVAWEAEKLAPLTSQLIGLVEDIDVGSFTKVARAGELPEKVVKKIEADSHWPRAGKMMLERAAPKLAAKWMNQTGVSAAYQDEMELMAGLSAVIVSRQKLMKELRELVAQFKAESGKAESAKP